MDVMKINFQRKYSTVPLQNLKYIPAKQESIRLVRNTKIHSVDWKYRNFKMTLIAKTLLSVTQKSGMVIFALWGVTVVFSITYH